MTSPGSSVNALDACETRVGDVVDHVGGGAVLHDLAVDDAVTSESPLGSRSVSIHGPSGQNVSKPLARAHCPSPRCRSRAVTSLATV